MFKFIHFVQIFSVLRRICFLLALCVVCHNSSSNCYNELHHHQQQQDNSDAPKTSIMRSGTPASPRASTTAATSSEHVGIDEGWLAEVVPGHPRGKGRHYANGSLLADRCQLTNVAVSRSLKRWVMA